MADLLQFLCENLPLDALGRLLSAIGAGVVIGWEREKEDKPAGLRTHVLVALGSALFMVAALELSTNPHPNTQIRLDPMRALAGVIGGVGFLGAGTIIQSGGTVRGITTAASIWICAAVGVCCGMGLYPLALLGGVLALAVLWLFGRLESLLFRGRSKRQVEPTIGDEEPEEG